MTAYNAQTIATDISMALDEPVKHNWSENDIHQFVLNDGVILHFTGGSYFSEDGETDWKEAFTLDELATDVRVLRQKKAK